MQNVSEKIAKISPKCNVCGACAKICTQSAITVLDGYCVTIAVDGSKCVGCGECRSVCAKDAITLISRY